MRARLQQHEMEINDRNKWVMDSNYMGVKYVKFEPYFFKLLLVEDRIERHYLEQDLKLDCKDRKPMENADHGRFVI